MLGLLLFLLLFLLFLILTVATIFLYVDSIFLHVHLLMDGCGGVFLLFILGSSLGGAGPVKGLRGAGRGGWCEEWARSG